MHAVDRKKTENMNVGESVIKFRRSCALSLDLLSLIVSQRVLNPKQVMVLDTWHHN
jgi:hypothetical protein